MAVAIDLGDPTSPFGSIHPRDKVDVGLRLSVGAHAIAYNGTDTHYLGMIAQSARMRYVSWPLLLQLVLQGDQK